MKTKNIIIVVVLMIILVAFNFKSEEPVSDSRPIKIGAIVSDTGVAANFGDDSRKSIDLAVEEINAKGGIKGRMVEVFFEDDQTDPKTALSAYEKLVGLDKVDGLIGGLFDFTAQPLFEKVKQDKIAFISPINFVIPGTFEMNEYSFVMYPLFSDVVGELDNIIKSRGIKKLGMVRYESAFSESIQNTLKGIMQEQGGEMVVDTYKVIGGSDFRTNISKLKVKNPDAVFLDMLDFDIVKYIKDASVLGFDKQIIGYTTFRDVVNKGSVDMSKIEGAIMLDWEVSSDEFIKAFTDKYGRAPRNGGSESYDAVYVLAEAIANIDSREEVAKYIESHDFETMNKKISFTKEHGVTSIPVKVMEVRDGKFVEVK